MQVIGITGTNGKSTTTTMCGAIARAHDAHAFVGGNLGTPYCQCALDVLDGKAGPRFAVHGTDLYVQDGPVLSRWRLREGVCVSAINLVVSRQRWAGSGMSA